MTLPAHRMGDSVLCNLFAPSPAGPVPGSSATMTPCAPLVVICGMAAARMGDTHPSGLGPHPLVKGSATVMICGQPAARLSDSCGCGGMAMVGAPTVLIGG